MSLLSRRVHAHPLTTASAPRASRALCDLCRIKNVVECCEACDFDVCANCLVISPTGRTRITAQAAAQFGGEPLCAVLCCAVLRIPYFH